MAITGEYILKDLNFLKSINGITISPKKSFCIIKIWMSNIEEQNPRKICKIEGFTVHNIYNSGILIKNK